MKKIYFFWDCDDICIKIIDEFRKFIDEKYDIFLPRDLGNLEKIEKQIGIQQSTLSQWWSVFNASDYLFKKELAPNKMLVELIKKLHTDGHESHFITSRSECELSESIEKWKDRYFGTRISSIHCSNDSKKKSELISDVVKPDDFLFFSSKTCTHAVEVAQVFQKNSLVFLFNSVGSKNQVIPNLQNLKRIQNVRELIFDINVRFA